MKANDAEMAGIIWSAYAGLGQGIAQVSAGDTQKNRYLSKV